jgi:hypothetical protein
VISWYKLKLLSLRSLFDWLSACIGQSPFYSFLEFLDLFV